MKPANRDDFRHLADGLPILVWTQRPDGTVDWVNQAWRERVSGTTPRAGWLEIVHPADLDRTTEAFARCTAAQTPFEMELRSGLNGEESGGSRLRVRVVPRFDDAGDFAGWTGTGVDVQTAHAAAERDDRGPRLRERFFSRLGVELSGALSLEQTLRVVTRSVVPEFADWALVNLRDDRGEIRLGAAYHRDTAMRGTLEALRGRAYANPAAESGTGAVLRTGAPVVYPAITKSEAEASVEVAFRETFAQIGYDSALIVPLFSAGKVVGTLNAVMRGSGRSFSSDDVPFFEELGRRITPAIGNATAYERERRVATTFQQAALVPLLPEVPGLTFDAMYQAAMLEATVGGDWYDAFRLPDGRVVLSIGDVAGKGLEAAVAMASVRQSIRTAALINPEPAAVLNAVDRIVRGMGQAPFVTAFVGVLDPVCFEFSFASAGHPPPMLRAPDGSVSNLNEGDLPLGLRGRAEDGGYTIDIAPGSVLLCYTDGLTEFDRDAVSGETRVRDAFRDASGDVARQIYDAIARGRPAQDDVAILAVSFHQPLRSLHGPRGATAWTFQVADPRAASRVRAELVARLREAGLNPAEALNAELVFGELVGNVVRYAAGAIEVLLDVSGQSPVLHVLDEGSGFEFRPRLPIDVMSERGRGLFLVTAFAEELSVERRRGGGSHARAVLSGRTRYRTASSLSRDAVL
jgi:anti-sigma regulatory factor (Ser/Thr protein kinase)